jgi:hypothetical protein
MPEHNPIQNDAREARRKARLGRDAVCILCGCNQWVALTPVPRSLLEAHHVACKANDGDMTVPLCRNCHAITTEELRRCDAATGAPAHRLARLVAILRAIGAFLKLLGEKMMLWANELAEFVNALDRRYPHWRQLAEAQ